MAHVDEEAKGDLFYRFSNEARIQLVEPGYSGLNRVIVKLRKHSELT